MGGGEESGSPQPHLHAEWQPFNPLTLNQRFRAQRPQDGCRHFSSSNYSTGGSCSGKKQKERKAETGEMEGSGGVHSHGLSLVWGQILSSQQVALNQMDAVIHGGADKNGQGDRLHSAHLPAAPVHDGHHEAHDACRGRGGSLDLAPPIQPWKGAGQIQRVSGEGDEVYGRSLNSGDWRDEEGQGLRGLRGPERGDRGGSNTSLG